jgi:hypothetical protein
MVTPLFSSVNHSVWPTCSRLELLLPKTHNPLYLRYNIRSKCLFPIYKEREQCGHVHGRMSTDFIFKTSFSSYIKTTRVQQNEGSISHNLKFTKDNQKIFSKSKSKFIFVCMIETGYVSQTRKDYIPRHLY